MLIDSSFKEYFSSKMIFAKVDAESADSVVATKYKVKGFPTFVLTDSKGVEIDRIVGYRDANVFIATLENYKNGIGTLNDLLAKAADSVDRAMYFEIANKYKYRGGNEEAKEWFNKVIDNGDTKDSLSGEARFSLADMYRRNKDYDKAIDAFTHIKKDFRKGMFAEGADIYTAICFKYKGDTTTAIKYFKNFIKDYPESEDTTYAYEQIAKLNGESLKN